jgi:hypothetical protein
MMTLAQLRSALQNLVQKDCNKKHFHHSKQAAHQAPDLWTME